MASKRKEITALKNLISETDLILQLLALPEKRTARCRELLSAALALTDDLLSQDKIPAAAALGRKGGSVTAQRDSDYFRKLAARRKHQRGALRGSHDSRMRDVRANYIQADEIWCYVGKKDRHVRVDNPDEFGNQRVFVAFDPQTKLVPSFVIGKRTKETTYRGLCWI